MSNKTMEQEFETFIKELEVKEESGKIKLRLAIAIELELTALKETVNTRDALMLTKLLLSDARALASLVKEAA